MRTPHCSPRKSTGCRTTSAASPHFSTKRLPCGLPHLPAVSGACLRRALASSRASRGGASTCYTGRRLLSTGSPATMPSCARPQARRQLACQAGRGGSKAARKRACLARLGSGCTKGAAGSACSSGAGRPVCGSQDTSASPAKGSAPSVPAVAWGLAWPAPLAPQAALLAALRNLPSCAGAAAAAAWFLGAGGCTRPELLGAGTAGRAAPSATRPVRRAANMLCASPGRPSSPSLSSLLLQLASPTLSCAGSAGPVGACATLADAAQGAGKRLSSLSVLPLAVSLSCSAGPAGASATLASAAGGAR